MLIIALGLALSGVSFSGSCMFDPTGIAVKTDGESDSGTDADPDADIDSGSDAGDADPDGGDAEVPVEDCTNGIDDDDDNLVDCQDPDCSGYQDPSGWACDENGNRKETNCSDNTDNDGDWAEDCEDSDCIGQSCGTGCECGSNGSKIQTICTLGSDGDGDGWIGCVDDDCQNDPQCTIYTAGCAALPAGSQCNVGAGFSCPSSEGVCSQYHVCVCE